MDQKEERTICEGGFHCLKVQDKEHSTQFIHLRPRNFGESISQCEISKNPTLTLTLKKNSNEIEIPNTISTLTHIDAFELIGSEQEVNVNAITSLHNQIQTCIIDRVQLTPNLNDKSNPIYTLTKLQHLELNECEISELNETISNLTSLQTLLLSYNTELNELPSSMTKLTSLLHLSLNNTNIQLDTLISVVCQLPSLQVLDLDSTYELETLPSQISQLTSLQHLSLSLSGIKSLPTQIGLLTQLHTLNLSCGSRSELPSDVEELKNLTQFLLLLPESPTQSKDANNQNFILKMEHWTKIVNLCLCGLNMETFPESVWKMSALRTLNLSRNFLRFIPTEIGLLSNLTNVDLSLNRISHIPTEFANLYQLQVLNLSHNQLTEIPEWFTSFSCLTRLDIESNQFTSFPHHLPIGLLTLDVGWNQISSIQSNTFCLFARINCLIFYSNQITTIPTEVALLTTLKELNFERNKLSFVPSDLGRLSHLKILYLADNDLTFIPINVFRFVKEFQYHYLESLKFPRITDDDWKEFATVYHDLYQD